MKKAFFTMILLAVVSFMSAQTLQFSYNGEAVEDGTEIIAEFDEMSYEYVAHLHIFNLSDEDQAVFVEQVVTETVPDAMIFMCWQQCLAPADTLVDGPVAIPAQSLSENELACHGMFSGEVSQVKAEYRAYTRSNPDEKISITVLFGTGANTNEQVVSLGHAYPNPASSTVHFDYDFNGNSHVNAVVYNLLGQEVKALSVNGNHGRIDISVDDLQPGIYFCSLQVNNAAVKTEKFIVKR